MLIGVAILILGFVLMAGGGSEDPNVFDASEVYSPRRITISTVGVVPGELHVAAYGPPATGFLAGLLAELRAADPLAPVTVVVPSATASTGRRRSRSGRVGGEVCVE